MGGYSFQTNLPLSDCNLPFPELLKYWNIRTKRNDHFSNHSVGRREVGFSHRYEAYWGSPL